jgi:hypothetical protein
MPLFSNPLANARDHADGTTADVALHLNPGFCGYTYQRLSGL